MDTFHEPMAPKICISYNLGLFLHPFNNFISLSLSLTHTQTHTREINVQLEAGPNTCVWTHCLPLSSSTHDHQKASHWISAEFSVCQVRKSQNQNLEFGPKESEVPKNKNLQKKSTLGLAFKLGGGREEGVKCC
jgi:hypothetical protein